MKKFFDNINIGNFSDWLEKKILKMCQSDNVKITLNWSSGDFCVPPVTIMKTIIGIKSCVIY